MSTSSVARRNRDTFINTTKTKTSSGSKNGTRIKSPAGSSSGCSTTTITTTSSSSSSSKRGVVVPRTVAWVLHPNKKKWWPSVLYPTWKDAAKDAKVFHHPQTHIRINTCTNTVAIDDLAKNRVPGKVAISRNPNKVVVCYYLGLSKQRETTAEWDITNTIQGYRSFYDQALQLHGSTSTNPDPELMGAMEEVYVFLGSQDAQLLRGIPTTTTTTLLPTNSTNKKRTNEPSEKEQPPTKKPCPNSKVTDKTTNTNNSTHQKKIVQNTPQWYHEWEDDPTQPSQRRDPSQFTQSFAISNTNTDNIPKTAQDPPATTNGRKQQNINQQQDTALDDTTKPTTVADTIKITEFVSIQQNALPKENIEDDVHVASTVSVVPLPENVQETLDVIDEEKKNSETDNDIEVRNSSSKNPANYPVSSKISEQNYGNTTSTSTTGNTVTQNDLESRQMKHHPSEKEGIQQIITPFSPAEISISDNTKGIHTVSNNNDTPVLHVLDCAQAASDICYGKNINVVDKNIQINFPAVKDATNHPDSSKISEHNSSNTTTTPATESTVTQHGQESMPTKAFSMEEEGSKLINTSAPDNIKDKDTAQNDAPTRDIVPLQDNAQEAADTSSYKESGSVTDNVIQVGDLTVEAPTNKSITTKISEHSSNNTISTPTAVPKVAENGPLLTKISEQSIYVKDKETVQKKIQQVVMAKDIAATKVALPLPDIHESVVTAILSNTLTNERGIRMEAETNQTFSIKIQQQNIAAKDSSNEEQAIKLPHPQQMEKGDRDADDMASTVPHPDHAQEEVVVCIETRAAATTEGTASSDLDTTENYPTPKCKNSRRAVTPYPQQHHTSPEKDDSSSLQPQLNTRSFPIVLSPDEKCGEDLDEKQDTDLWFFTQ